MNKINGIGLHELEERTLVFFQHHDLSIHQPALVGFSGGPDSTALLVILKEIGAGPLVAIHIDHGIRPQPEREREAGLVRDLTHQLDISLIRVALAPGSVEKRARQEASGLEAAARWYRHRIFSSRLATLGLNRIYLGHNQDDSVENSLMAFLGGAGLSGLKGIPGIGRSIVRPLMAFRKDELLAYLSEKKIPFSLDSTNADFQLRRNRIRSRLIPLLDEEFPGWRKGLIHTMSKLSLDETVLQSAIDRAPCFNGDPVTQDLIVPLAEFLQAAPAVRMRSLISAIGILDEGRPSDMRFSGGRVSWRFAAAVHASILAGRFYEAHGLRVSMDSDTLRIGPSLDFEGADGYFIALDRCDHVINLELPAGLHLEINWENSEGGYGILEDSFEFPLILRSRRPGDSIALPSGSKAIDKLLASWHMPGKLRNRVPLAEDRRGVVAVLGEGFPGGKNKFRHHHPRPDSKRFLSIVAKGA